jgi:2-amino-4-hydroxy-6-hydroxymethyldihydropteridine diphosphokinase
MPMTNQRRHRAYLGLGGNLGDRLGYLAAALAAIRELPGTQLVRWSRAVESEPWGITDQPRFLNMAAEIETELDPHDLAARLLEIEGQVGRQRRQRWGPREIDVDILLYDDVHMETEMLTIPHPRMMERSFVVVPLAEIAPDVILPDGRPAAVHAAECWQEVKVYGEISL